MDYIMRKTNIIKGKYLVFGLLLVLFFNENSLNAQKVCIENNKDQIVGLKDGFSYELWNQYAKGQACMTIANGALFSGEWSDIENYLARRGLSFDKKRKHQEIRDFYATYDCEYKPSKGKNGNSYLSVYGWTVEPLIEYFIIEDWRNWVSYMSTDSTFIGFFDVNGSIHISDHFNKWESFGLTMGNLHEVSFVTEGYKSSGSFNFKELDVFVRRNK